MSDPAAIARTIIDSNLYMVLGTTDDNGHPWVSPVFYAAAAGYTDFYWISTPGSDHSRNVAARPQVSIAIFNSQVRPGTGQAVYMSATATELSGADLAHGLEIYPGPSDRGGRTFGREEVEPPGLFRLYRATASQHSILCPRTSGQPCAPHGIAHDHRIPVTL